MNEYSSLQLVQKDYGIYQPLGLKWVGDKSIARLNISNLRHVFSQSSISVDRTTYKQGDTVAVDGYRLKVLDYEFVSDALIVCHDDDPKVRLLFAFDWAREKARDVKTRIIMTFVVWGLAEKHPYCYPTWSDIKFVKWLRGD